MTEFGSGKNIFEGGTMILNRHTIYNKPTAIMSIVKASKGREGETTPSGFASTKRAWGTGNGVRKAGCHGLSGLDQAAWL